MKQTEHTKDESVGSFLDHIAAKLGRPRLTVKPAHPYRGTPDVWKAFEPEPEEIIEMFQKHWELAGGHSARFGSLADALAFIAEFCRKTGVKQLLMQQQPELADGHFLQEVPGVICHIYPDVPKDRLIDVAAASDVGLVVADAAVAFTGSVVLKSSADKGRITSLLPQVFVAIIHERDMVATLGGVMTGIEQTAVSDMPAGIHWVSGPSRSADIENDLTIGVHGPGIVYALIVP